MMNSKKLSNEPTIIINKYVRPGNCPGKTTYKSD